MNLFELAIKPKRKYNRTAAFVFDWDIDEGDGEIIGIIKDVRLRDGKGNEIRYSSLVQEERNSGGWDPFFDHSDIKVSGRYRWEGTYFASQDYYGDWDCGWDLVSLEPADRKTRRALVTYAQQEL